MKTPPTIGVLSPFVSGAYFGAVIRGVLGAAAKAGARVVAIQTFDPGVSYADGAPDSAAFHIAAWAHLDGCIVILDGASPTYVDAIKRSGKPVVMISNTIDGLQCPVVTPDNRIGVRDAVRHLIEHGHRKIAFAGMMHQHDIHERYASYVDTLREAGIEPDPSLLFATADNEEICGVQAGQQMLASGLKSTAVVVATDLNAIGIMQALTASGLVLPRDQAIVGFDDVDAATFVRPALSSVRLDFGSLGRLAAGLLLDKMAGLDVEDRDYEWPTIFVPRESCGCANAIGEIAVRPTDEPLGRTVAARRRWLKEQLDRTLTADDHAAGRESTVTAAATLVAQTLEAAAKGRAGPTDVVVHDAVEALFQRSPRNQTVLGIMAAARRFGRSLVDVNAINADAIGQRVTDRIVGLTLMLSGIHSHDQFSESAYFRGALGTQYAVAMDLLRSHEEDPRSLQWLERTSVRGGCLGLWSETPGELGPGADPTLAVVGAFNRDAADSADGSGDSADGSGDSANGSDHARRSSPGLNETVAASAFPPRALLT